MTALSCESKTETQEDAMPSIHVDIETAEWTSGVPFYGAGAVHQGQDIVQLKILATALSDEHVFNLEGGRATKSGAPARASGGYTLNPEGQPHSALIATETVSLVIYRREPDEVRSIEVVNVESARGADL